MTLRKYMHPRNIYKKSPDYKQLTTMYPEFRKIAIVDIAGNVHINYQNKESLRILAEVLLKHDFNLTIKIPPNKLIPTLPLRLNYVLWIEDLITHESIKDIKSVVGIDIGTGAVCIYPILFAKMFGCHMIGTEIDETSIQTAESNIRNNSFEDLIKVVKGNNNTIFKDVIEESQTYDFAMCNPPFFENHENLVKKSKRLPPRNAPTGNQTELTIEGGEKSFVMKMIDESMNIQSKIRIYTTMLGQKKTLQFLLEVMRKKQIENLTWTEFCQGHTTRWGLAWSFLPKKCLNLTKAPVIRKNADSSEKLKNTHPVNISFPVKDRFSSIDQFTDHFKEWMRELQVNIKERNTNDKKFSSWTCVLEAQTDTWTHSRRKRRLLKRLNMVQSKTQDTEECVKDINFSIPNLDTNYKSNESISETDKKLTAIVSVEHCASKIPLLVCSLFITIHADELSPSQHHCDINMMFERGHGGKNALETFRQHLINRLNLREYYQQCNDAKTNRKWSKKMRRS